MLKLITINKFKLILLSVCSLLSVSLFAQNEKTTTEQATSEGAIVMTQAELESFLSTIADARRTQLKERNNKNIKQELAELRLKYNDRQVNFNDRQTMSNGNNTISNSQILNELRYLNQRIDNLSSNRNTGSSLNRDNSTIIMPSNSSPNTLYPQSGKSSTTLIPNNTNDDKINELQRKIDSLRNANPNKGSMVNQTAFADSLKFVKGNLQDIRRQMDSLESKLMKKDKAKTKEVAPENKSYFKQQVYFDNNSSALNTSFSKNIQDLSQIMAKYPQAKILLEGWASPKGNATHNKQLSMRRSESVAQAFINNGIDPDRVITSFKGEDTLSSEAHARRVDMAIIVR